MLYYIYGNGGLIGFAYNSNTYYYHKNIFNDIIGILDSNYNEIVTYEYDSWGAIVNITDNSNMNLGTINPFRYRSYYYDDETGLYYLNSRYYNPNWGRFINLDSEIGANDDIISSNLFQYVSNNTIIKVDKSGKSGSLALPWGNSGFGNWEDMVAGALGAAQAYGKQLAGALSASGLGALAAAGGLITLTGLTLYGAYLYGEKARSQVKTDTAESTLSPKKETKIYRYGGTSPGNFKPRDKDFAPNPYGTPPCLSFSYTPKLGAAEFVLEDLEATGMFIIINDHDDHVAVFPRHISMFQWYEQGTTSLETLTLKRMARKYNPLK